MTPMSTDTRIRLSIMMFLQYAFNGIWFIPLVTYLTKAGYTGPEVGSMYGTFALGTIFAPFFVGMLVDRFFSGEKVLGVLNLLSAVTLYLASTMAVDADGGKQYDLFYWILLLHFLCYMPTWALTNSIALYQMDNPGKQFPGVRVMGTLGWIAVGTISLFSSSITSALGVEGNIEATRLPMLLGSAIGLVTGILSFFMPKTPPKQSATQTTFSDILGVKALVLFKDRNFLVFAASSLLIMFPALFYWQSCNLFLNEATALVTSIPAEERAGLNEGVPSQSLKETLEQNGITFSSDPNVVVLVADKEWELTNATGRLLIKDDDGTLNAYGGMSYVMFKMTIGQMAEVIFLVLMPWFFKRFGVKLMLLIGMLAWTARFFCFGFGNPGNMVPLLYLGLALHGVCYDFFFVTGQLYVDKKAPKEIQAQAQGLISLITFGLGWFVGSHLAGMVVGHYAITQMVEGTEQIVDHVWKSVWLWPIAMVIVITLFFAVLFKDDTVVGREEPKDA